MSRTLQFCWKRGNWQLNKSGLYLKTGQDVVFACEGDVSFYSTFTYLAQTLQASHPDVVVEAVPGVCSPLAAAASLGLPLTIRQQRLTVLPAPYNLTELEAALKWADVVVLMKLSSVYPQVWQVLEQFNLLSQSYVVEWATLPQQRLYKGLQDLPDLQLHYFSLLIVQVALDPDPA